MAGSADIFDFSTNAELEGVVAPGNRRAPMKIAFMGNMNNNSFSIMRYFRDLGADAHLLLYANDGQGLSAHFAPEADTWKIGAWSPYIRRLGFINGRYAVTGIPHRLKPPPSKKFLQEQLGDFDAYVGSGIAPAILSRIGKKLDIFFPYSAGIEFVESQEICKEMQASILRRPLLKYVRRRQIRGILQARHCLNAELSVTAKVFDKIGRRFAQLAIPMVYNREPVPNDAELPSRIVDMKTRLAGLDLTIFTHARQMWVRRPNSTDREFEEGSKHNDWLFRGFAEFLRRNPTVKSRLCAVEYGPDVEATKRLCSEIGIEDSVIWLPQMHRKEIMYVLAACDIGVGEFYTLPGMIWGGTGWEVLASGKPLLQAFNFTPGSFSECYGHPPPPLLDAKSAEDVALRLEEAYRDKGRCSEFGMASKEWFNEYNGIALAKKWLAVIAD